MTPGTPVVSVLMTAFNRERYIGAAIESVLAQTFGDFELIVVDDASSDHTLEIAQSYAAIDSRIRVESNEKNLGDYPNRNRAAWLARGQFIKYQDSDDLMYPHCLATIVPAMLAAPTAGIGLSGSGHWPGGPCPMLLTPRMSYQREFLGSGLFNCGPACAIFRREVFASLGGFRNFGAASDYVFWIGACAQHSVLLLPGDLFWYRRHDGQELHGSRAARDYAQTPQHTWRALNSPECPLEPDEREVAKRNVAFITARSIWWHVKRRQWSLASLCFRSSGMTLGEWVRYLRRQRRDWRIGTPLTADGEFVDPSWLNQPQTVEETVAR